MLDDRKKNVVLRIGLIITIHRLDTVSERMRLAETLGPKEHPPRQAIGSHYGTVCFTRL